ncbi:DNA repair protein RecN [Enterovibrio norvegicus FF-33]|uniref:DNA repair protein RecN n=1 Tax=Enterovibrio norvegicus FF-454 TaxID=1185651 RepID=A0A1E5BYB5_9GAMM|nr:DNA repair protein RecN [Enterovibrio norvegicus]OEE58245.1 DNA repair protein RecN [Enterovibrio norvegicus FF-454]OEE69008.1 DNA repair protein RecN [Enterovibrio norvegicus FF-33]OEE89844.1 DNA repair protein RecN [Enterovibrio norvegicus FF-162]
MLAHITIQNFAIVKALELDFHQGMTTITGETGAGKSIAIDALGLCLGDRADASMVRPGEDKAEIVTLFHLQNNPAARRWLEDNELADGEECILRRVITKEGRSRAFINGSPVPASQQKSLGQHLINIHGQHAHQLLMRNDFQLTLLDQYAGHQHLLVTMRQRYQDWRAARNELKQLEKNKEAFEAQKQLLEYQVNELNELALGETEYPQLEEEHKRLSNCGDIAICSQSVIQALSEDDDNNALHLLQFAQQKLAELTAMDSQFKPLMQMLDEACIQVQETSHEIISYMDRLDMDPARLSYLDDRMASIMRLSRKHQVLPAELYQAHQSLVAELDSLNDSDNQIEKLTADVDVKHQACLTAAEKLSKSRKRYAKELDKLISSSMHELSMQHGKFHIDINSQPDSNLSPMGVDSIEFLVSTNPGQPMQALGKVASGGELSRISLAIQVITAQKVDTPSLIFDEVDVGISGPTAAIVGKLLRRLGESTQVMCVTHLPQVAGCGHQQMFVTKTSEKGTTTTSMIPLDVTARVQELARLLGGSEITEHTLANAKELLVAA